MPPEVLEELFIRLVGNQSQRQLPQGDQVVGAEEVRQGLGDSFFRVDVVVQLGTGQLVNQDDAGFSAQDRIEVHLLQTASPVFDHLAGDDLEAIDELIGVRPPVALDEPDDDVGAAACRRWPSLSMA